MSVFNTDFLHAVLTTMTSKNANLILHVGSVDSWPTHLTHGKQAAAMIFNTDYANEAGEHWVAVFIDGQNETGYIFDSLPLRPFPNNVLHKLAKICTLVHNVNPDRFQLQDRQSQLCGLYCLAFLNHFHKREPFLLCPNNPILNDVVVLEHVLPYIGATFDL